MGKLVGPHFVGLLHADVLECGIPYLAMELLQGEDLEQSLERRDRLGVHEVVSLGEQASSALSTAHDLGIIHRDVKPSNLFRQHDGALKVLDFGISKIVASVPTNLRITRTGELVGSPSYVSPDQLRDPSSVGPLADVWSLGATLFHLTTGSVPFSGSTLLEIFDAIRFGAHVDPRTLRSGIPPQLAELINACLEKVPENRITMPELRSRLGSFPSSVPHWCSSSAATANTLPDLGNTRTGLDTHVSGEYAASAAATESSNDTLASPTDHTATKPHAETAERPLVRRLGTPALVAVLVVGVGVTFDVIRRRATEDRPEVPSAGVESPANDTSRPFVTGPDHRSALDVEPLPLRTPSTLVTGGDGKANVEPKPASFKRVPRSLNRVVTAPTTSAAATSPDSVKNTPHGPSVRPLDTSIDWAPAAGRSHPPIEH